MTLSFEELGNKHCQISVQCVLKGPLFMMAILRLKHKKLRVYNIFTISSHLYKCYMSDVFSDN